jgi:hypothetical protein
MGVVALTRVRHALRSTLGRATQLEKATAQHDTRDLSRRLWTGSRFWRQNR